MPPKGSVTVKQRELDLYIENLRLHQERSEQMAWLAVIAVLAFAASLLMAIVAYNGGYACQLTRTGLPTTIDR